MSCTSRNSVDVCWVGGDSEEYIMRARGPEGEVIDLEGISFAMTLRDSSRSLEPAIPPKIAVVDWVEGTVTFSFSTSDTASLLGNSQKVKFFYDTQATDGDIVKTWTSGEIYITAGITV